MQGNPFQPDVNYRGYTASPLLGTPQGLSVYMDGVRLNQPFGDVVSWDLIPRLAIASTTLMPGIEPAVRAQHARRRAVDSDQGRPQRSRDDGRRPSTASYGAARVEFEHGGSTRERAQLVCRRQSVRRGRLARRLAVGRAASVRQARLAATRERDLDRHGRVRRQRADRQRPAGAAPPRPRLRQRLHEAGHDRQPRRRSQRHRHGARCDADADAVRQRLLPRHPDAHAQRRHQRGLARSVRLPADRRRTARAGRRRLHRLSDQRRDAANTPFPFWRCIAQRAAARRARREVQRPDQPHATPTQHNYGASGQVHVGSDRRLGARNQFTAGGAFDRSTRRLHAVHASSATSIPTAASPASDAFGDGVTGGNVDGEPFDTRVDLDGRVHTGSVYATDTLTFATRGTSRCRAATTATTSTTAIASVPAAGAGSLDGDHTFSRFNPAAGVTFSPAPRSNLYAGYSEGSRAPTSIELGCADPDQPCKLPNAMAGDPPLDQVVTRTSKPASAADARARAQLERRRLPRATTTTTSCSSRRRRPASATSRTSARRGGRASSLAQRCAGQSRHGRARLLVHRRHISKRRNNPRRRATARTTTASSQIHRRRSHSADPAPHAEGCSPTCSATSKLSIDLDVLAASGFARPRQRKRRASTGRPVYLGPGSIPGYAVDECRTSLHADEGGCSSSCTSTTCSTRATTPRRNSARQRLLVQERSWPGRCRQSTEHFLSCDRRSMRRARRRCGGSVSAWCCDFVLTAKRKRGF